MCSALQGPVAEPLVQESYCRPDVWGPPKAMNGTFGGINQPTAGARFEKTLPKGKHPYQLYSLGCLPSPCGHICHKLLKAGCITLATVCDVTGPPVVESSCRTPNGQKVTILLEELGVEYDAWPIKILDQEQFGSVPLCAPIAAPRAARRLTRRPAAGASLLR
jgi:GST-like protein